MGVYVCMYIHIYTHTHIHYQFEFYWLVVTKSTNANNQCYDYLDDQIRPQFLVRLAHHALLPLSSTHAGVAHQFLGLPLCHLSSAALWEPLLLPVSVTNLRNTSALSSHWLEGAACFAASDTLMGSISLAPQAWQGWVSLMVNTDALGEAGDSASLSGKLLIAVSPGSCSITPFYRHFHFSSKWWPEDVTRWTTGTIPEICIDMIVLLMDGNPSNVSHQTSVLVAVYPRLIRYEVESYFLLLLGCCIALHSLQH